MLSVTTSALCDGCDWCRMTSCVLLPVVLVARAAVHVCMVCVIEAVQHCTIHQYTATAAICIACVTSCESLQELQPHITSTVCVTSCVLMHVASVASEALYYMHELQPHITSTVCVTSCVLMHVASVASEALYYRHGLSNILCITACCVSSQCSHVLLYAWLEQAYYWYCCTLHQ